MTSVSLTARAVQRVRELRDGVPDAAGYGLRIAVASYGWTQRYRLSLGPGPGNGEVVIRLDEVDVFVDGRSARLVDGVHIDYVERATSAGFTFHNPGSVPPPDLAGMVGPPPVGGRSAPRRPERPPAGAGPPRPNRGPDQGQDRPDQGQDRPDQGQDRSPGPDGDAPGELRHRVEAAMADIRPYLWRDGGDAAVVDVDGGTAWIELTGACSGCAAADSTVVDVVERWLTAAVPDIVRVRTAP